MNLVYKSNDYNVDLLCCNCHKCLQNKTACIFSFVVNSVCILGFFFVLNSVRVKPSAAHQYPNVNQVPTPRTEDLLMIKFSPVRRHAIPNLFFFFLISFCVTHSLQSPSFGANRLINDNYCNYMDVSLTRFALS